MTKPVEVMPRVIPADTQPALTRHVERLDLDGKHVYMIGIGGCGMSGLARLLVTHGAIVSGSDMAPSDETSFLQSQGIHVEFEQAKGQLPRRCDLVVHSAAIKPEHPEMMETERRSIPSLVYAEALGKCMIGRTGVAIAGTHGKSTTTALLGCVLTDCGLDPSVIVGATCPQLLNGPAQTKSADPAVGFRMGSLQIPAGTHAGKPGILVAEACEYNRSFHNFRPQIGSISSVEADHLDIYGTLDAVVEAFHDFAKLIPPAEEGGVLLIGHDTAHRREVTAGLHCKIETIGFTPNADWVVSYEAEGRQVKLKRGRKSVAEWSMLLPGAHNAVNAATAVAIAVTLGADPKTAAHSASNFRGIHRRSELLGERAIGAGTVRVYDDYGHHPTEIDVTLKALREFEKPETRGGRLICVFQPHQHSRTRHLLEEFANSVSNADVVIVPHIYFVRDSQAEKQKVSAADLVDRLRTKNIKAKHVYPFEAIVEELESLCRPNDVVVVMGAGPVWKIGKQFVEGQAEAAQTVA